jgi:shikimate kinase
MSLVLVGFMGTGKSLVGRILANHLGAEFVDTDAWVERDTGMSIAQLFQQQGESAFRECETRVLRALALAPCRERVIATGGGIVLREENWEWLRRLGKVVELTALPATIAQRLAGDQQRPLLSGTPAECLEKITAMLAARAPYYLRADFHQPTDGRTPEAIAASILEI